MRFIIIPLLLTVFGSPACAAEKTMRYFYDGARVEYELQAQKGSVEVSLPSDVQPNSLRIKPLAGAVIAGVSISEAIPKKPSGELAKLEERRNRLVARLKAVEAREEIFSAAAKSQSAKAPRKTKTNPDPLATIRQGTDLALRNLEETYRVKLQTEKELRELEAGMKSVKEKEGHGGSVARIRVKPAGARIAVSYILPRHSWKPSYDFELSDKAAVAITMKAVLPVREKGVAYRVVPASLASWDGSVGSSPSNDESVARFSFPAWHERLGPPGLSTFTFSFRNEASHPLPPGEATCYRVGEYFGTFSFAGMGPGETTEVTCGR